MRFLACFLLWAVGAQAGEIADCARDRFMEAYHSPQIRTLDGMIVASDTAMKVCLGEHPTAADYLEFDDGVDGAFDELLAKLKGQKL